MKPLFFFLFLSVTLLAKAQTESKEAAYKRYPTLPAIQILLGDSTTKYTKENIPKNKPVLLMLFSPDCSHCQHTAEELYKYKDSLKNVQVVMATLHSITQMNEFVAKYKLNEIPNVVAGKDIYFILPPFFEVKNLPFMAFYNSKGNLISIYEGSLDIVHVLKIFNDNK